MNDDSLRADVKEYFNGSIKAWGLIQDWRKRPVHRFEINMIGEWDGDTGVLKEDYSYYNGKTQHREWSIKKISDHKYEGRADDLIQKARGETDGYTIHWNYVMDVPVDHKTYRIYFDDWMYLMKDGVMINRSYLKKFGITVAELTIFMQKK